MKFIMAALVFVIILTCCVSKDEQAEDYTISEKAEARYAAQQIITDSTGMQRDVLPR